MVQYTVFGGTECDIDIPKKVFPTEQEIQIMESHMIGCEHGWFTSCYEEKKLHYRKFLPKNKQPKAIVIWMHGIQTHCGRAHVFSDEEEKGGGSQEQTNPKEPTRINMALLSHTLVHKNGYALYAFDMIGHGYSEGQRFYVPYYEIVRDDYITFVKLVSSLHNNNREEPPIPIFLMGESFGALMTLHVTKYFQDKNNRSDNNRISSNAKSDDNTIKGLDSIILLAPAIDCPPPIITRSVMLFLELLVTPYIPTWRLPRYAPNPAKPANLWRDPKMLYLYSQEKRVQEMLLEPAYRQANFGTILTLLNAILDGREQIVPGLEVPLAIAHGTGDKAVPKQASDFIVKNILTPTTEIDYKLIEGAYHDVLADPSTNEVIQFITNWISKRLELLSTNNETQPTNNGWVYQHPSSSSIRSGPTLSSTKVQQEGSRGLVYYLKLAGLDVSALIGTFFIVLIMIIIVFLFSYKI